MKITFTSTTFYKLNASQRFPIVCPDYLFILWANFEITNIDTIFTNCSKF